MYYFVRVAKWVLINEVRAAGVWSSSSGPKASLHVTRSHGAHEAVIMRILNVTLDVTFIPVRRWVEIL